MTDKLPPNLLALFAPRPGLRFLPPSDHASEDRKTAAISGVAAFLPQLEEYKENDHYEPTESWLERKFRVKQEKKQRQEKLLKEAPAQYKPQDDPNIRGDAFKTLIVARLSYDATEQDLESEFGRFGPIERIRIVVDTHQDEKPSKKKKHRGYAFVVYEREKDMRAALDNCDGIRIKDRRIKVDVERGRTVKGWVPRRLGGGKGGRGYTKAAPPPRPMGFGGPAPGGPGFRGGFGGRGGGFRGGFEQRGGYGGRGRGGIGFQGGGGFRGQNGYGAPPPNAPAGPGGQGQHTRGGGFSGGRGSYGGTSGSPDRNGSAGGYDSRGGGRSYDDRGGGGYRGYQRDGPPRGGSGSNMEPVRPRDGGYRDRDRDGGYGGRPREEDSRKRQYESSGYEEDPRKLRRY